MDWGQVKEEENGTYKIPDGWIFVSYFEALNLLFRVENALRMFVYCVLKENFGSGWTGLQISTAETESIAIGKLSARRYSQQQDFAYLGLRNACPMMYLNSGELIYLIFADNYWKHFAPYLPGKKEILRNKLEEISAIRNSLAHFRPVSKDEVDVIKQNSKHVFGGIESCLREMTACNRVVPTNTPDAWYKAISTLSNELCKFTLYESTDRRWVRLELAYSCAHLSSTNYGDDAYVELINLSAPDILKQYKELANRVLFVSEFMPVPKMPEDRKPTYIKQISFTYSRESVETNYVEICEEQRKLLTQIAEECALLTGDSLAAGKLLSISRLFAWYKKSDERNFWDMNEDRLLSPVREDAPAEFWGTIGRYNSGYFDATSRYPWMASAISKGRFPF